MASAAATSARACAMTDFCSAILRVGVADIGLRRIHVGFGLCDRGLVIARIDLHQPVAGLDLLIVGDEQLRRHSRPPAARSRSDRPPCRRHRSFRASAASCTSTGRNRPRPPAPARGSRPRRSTACAGGAALPGSRLPARDPPGRGRRAHDRRAVLGAVLGEVPARPAIHRAGSARSSARGAPGGAPGGATRRRNGLPLETVVDLRRLVANRRHATRVVRHAHALKY